MKDYGLRESLYELTAYVLGSSAMPHIPYREDGNWESFLPTYESQSDRFETFGCTAWGSQNQIETFLKSVYGIEANFSERFTYLLTPITPGYGVDPQKTYECIRHDGLIDQAEMPMTDTLQEFVDYSDLSQSKRAHGQNWLVKHDFQHEWLWTNRPDNWKEILREALKTSPIGVSVYAWAQEGDEYVSLGQTNNHWCLLYKIDEDGHPWVFDSYDHSKKKLSKDHNIRRAKRIWINRKTVSSMRKQISILQKIVNLLMQTKTMLDVATAALGTDVTPDDRVPDEVACAITVTTLLKKVYPGTPLIDGTWTLYDYLRKPTSNFMQIPNPEPGCIVLSPTGTGNRGTIGHTGIFMEDDTIASNNSYGIYKGKFTKNFTRNTWERRYAVSQGMPVYFFKHV